MILVMIMEMSVSGQKEQIGDKNQHMCDWQWGQQLPQVHAQNISGLQVNPRRAFMESKFRHYNLNWITGKILPCSS